MKKELNGKTEWQEFRNEILELVILYQHVKEFSEFDKKKIDYIKNFFYSSKKQAITSFFIKVGFLLNNGTPSLKNFMPIEDYNTLYQLYKSKIKSVRDFIFAHNLKQKIDKKFTLFNEDIDNLYTKIISSAKEIDKRFNENWSYDFVHNADGIKSIESLIDDVLELENLKDQLLNTSLNAKVELVITTGKIKIIEE